jgi:hypothetical protein
MQPLGTGLPFFGEDYHVMEMFFDLDKLAARE